MSSRREEGPVVERSKRQPPSWMEWQPHHIHEDSNTYSFVAYRSKIMDLPLGVKQTTLGAMVGSQNALHELVRKELFDLAKANNVQIQSRQELDEWIMKSVEKMHKDFAFVKDIYFEKVQANSNGTSLTSFYKVYVLIQFHSEKMPELLKDLRKKLEKSTNPDLAALSKLINPKAKRATG